VMLCPASNSVLHRTSHAPQNTPGCERPCFAAVHGTIRRAVSAASNQRTQPRQPRRAARTPPAPCAPPPCPCAGQPLLTRASPGPTPDNTDRISALMQLHACMTPATNLGAVTPPNLTRAAAPAASPCRCPLPPPPLQRRARPAASLPPPPLSGRAARARRGPPAAACRRARRARGRRRGAAPSSRRRSRTRRRRCTKDGSGQTWRRRG
jgi:hypothetical protein